MDNQELIKTMPEENRTHMVCECGNDLFHNGPRGGAAQMFLCSECHTEYTNYIFHLVKNGKASPKRIKEAYGITTKEYEENNTFIKKLIRFFKREEEDEYVDEKKC